MAVKTTWQLARKWRDKLIFCKFTVIASAQAVAIIVLCSGCLPLRNVQSGGNVIAASTLQPFSLAEQSSYLSIAISHTPRSRLRKFSAFLNAHCVGLAALYVSVDTVCGGVFGLPDSRYFGREALPSARRGCARCGAHLPPAAQHHRAFLPLLVMVVFIYAGGPFRR